MKLGLILKCPPPINPFTTKPTIGLGQVSLLLFHFQTGQKNACAI